MSAFITGVAPGESTMLPVDGPTPRYIPGALTRINGLRKRHEVGKGVPGQVLGQLIEGTVYVYK